ncbi:radical SAM family heme chaperone HemW [Yeosuana sp. MJ-SS3]|uniref:Heme chaperone HemW n=1 Tax=Gilvirhabdus luticola TaxID=3079858 RepID=A0ABU3U437_9FLAO|nr:radical SAM family heme chaperone HemW [Yeosuana sp. MJ-SS3]MDU8885087.1 radical SAM family heme chaperone HemW [Yeosuana sp. MJ-SS3]
MSGIYIHIPFCKQACYYCDFHFSTSMKKKDELVQALVHELQLRKDEINETVETIYFGGGTPSLLSERELNLLISTINNNYTVSENPEITLEANPDDLTNQQINKLKQTQINRLSIGIQSFFDDDLESMNRAHNSNEANDCLSVATNYFDNITIDLIYGIPNMTLEKWHDNLQTAFSFGINHISSYALTVEPKTALHSFIKKGTYPPIDEALTLQHFNHLIEETEKRGFVQYEISNFGKPDYFSKHNTSYWLGKLYLGIGPSAHSYNGNSRSWNISNNIKYMRAIQNNELPSTRETLSQNDIYNEYIMTSIRTIWGISIETTEKEFGSNYLDFLLKNVQPHIDNNLINYLNNSLQLTKKGKFLADGIASSLFMI